MFLFVLCVVSLLLTVTASLVDVATDDEFFDLFLVLDDEEESLAIGVGFFLSMMNDDGIF